MAGHRDSDHPVSRCVLLLIDLVNGHLRDLLAGSDALVVVDEQGRHHPC